MRSIWVLLIALACMLSACMTGTSNSLEEKGATCPKAVKALKARTLYGNIYGTILSEDSGRPLAGVNIYLAREPVQRMSRYHPQAQPTNNGWIVVPVRDPQYPVAQTNAQGAFIISGIPMAQLSQPITVTIQARDRALVVIDQIPLRPGASMALEILCHMPPLGRVHLVKGLQNTIQVQTRYHHENSTTSTAPATR